MFLDTGDHLILAPQVLISRIMDEISNCKYFVIIILEGILQSLNHHCFATPTFGTIGTDQRSPTVYLPGPQWEAWQANGKRKKIIKEWGRQHKESTKLYPLYPTSSPLPYEQYQPITFAFRSRVVLQQDDDDIHFDISHTTIRNTKLGKRVRIDTLLKYEGIEKCFGSTNQKLKNRISFKSRTIELIKINK